MWKMSFAQDTNSWAFYSPYILLVGSPIRKRGVSCDVLSYSYRIDILRCEAKSAVSVKVGLFGMYLIKWSHYL